MRNRFRGVLAAVVIAALALSGCVTTGNRTIDKFDRGKDSLSVLLMPVDIELSELGASGIPEPKAEWTAVAETHVLASIKSELSRRNMQLRTYHAPPPGTPEAETQTQLVKLHNAIGAVIRLHYGVNPPLVLQLPTKLEAPVWSLGREVTKLRQTTGADYALFVYVRDSYTSAGRVAVAVVFAALFGVHVPLGRMVGFASLVDLRSGDLVWFNNLSGTGDLRNQPDASKSVRDLFSDLPEG